MTKTLSCPLRLQCERNRPKRPCLQVRLFFSFFFLWFFFTAFVYRPRRSAHQHFVETRCRLVDSLSSLFVLIRIPFFFSFADFISPTSVSPANVLVDSSEKDDETPPPPIPSHDDADFEGLESSSPPSSSSGSAVISTQSSSSPPPPPAAAAAEVSSPPMAAKSAPRPPRESIAREILSTEKTYVDSLNVLKAVFEAPLKVGSDLKKAFLCL